MQKAAIEYVQSSLTQTSQMLTSTREQKQLAREDPIAAAAAVGGEAQPQTNVENLLDIDFDGAIPASLQGQASTSSGLEDLVGANQSGGAPPGSSNAMDDLLGVFGSPPPAATGDLMNGFGGLNLGATANHETTASKRTNEDILGLF